MKVVAAEVALRKYGSARARLFAANEAWIREGKPMVGPIAVEWVAAGAEHLDALATLARIADDLVKESETP